ncbi:hypothetical protein [Limisalsivibrio acetivorans]|uniref:hypothetical protein n=1 Tax=Limisalsivibrio acetivorans TaxID=1304888 RepID=UPI0003B52C24|nr:hypothetical protein [Limisalsivibrio acetivorans]
MTLKDLIKHDTASLMNTSEFAETIDWNGKEITVVFDTDEGNPLKSLNDMSSHGIVSRRIRLYTPADSFDEKPAERTAVQIDGRYFYVEAVIENMSMLEIELKIEEGR